VLGAWIIPVLVLGAWIIPVLKESGTFENILLRMEVPVQ